MATFEVRDDEIVDAIIAKPELISRAIERLKANVDSLAYHHQRALGMAAAIGKQRERVLELKDGIE